MTPTDKDIIWEAVVLMDAARKNAYTALDKLTKYIIRDDIVISKERIANELLQVSRYLNDIHEKKKPIIKLVGRKDGE